jgi:hypothetical protein
LERFRHSLLTNDLRTLVDEFDHYRTTWSTNKFRMFITNVLIVMRSWANNQLSSTNDNGDNHVDPSNESIVNDRMRTSAHHLFVAIVTYLQTSTQLESTERMSIEIEFDMWKRVITNQWTMNEQVC